MHPPHRILKHNHVHRLATERLQEQPRFKNYKRKTSAQGDRTMLGKLA